ncbi:MAG: radical SAM protein [Bacillota bacterium]|nr:radical SAM protein [Bacillota bacterium]
MKDDALGKLMSKSIAELFRDALVISLKEPRKAAFLLKTIRNQKHSAKRRMMNEENGVHVPPFLIVSITHRCNLMCKGCYARTKGHELGPEIDTGRLKKVFEEAEELGISIALLAGGEPLVKKEEVFELAGAFHKIIFPVFTNGTLISDGVIADMKHFLNIVPVISIEGRQVETDERRGKGIYKYIENLFEKLKKNRIFFGTSITVTRDNYSTVTEEEFIKNLIDKGCRLFFFVEYVPVKEGTEDCTLTEEQRRRIPEIMERFREKFRGLFVAFPGDEEAMGGCIAAGRGFIHINPEGDVEPCPFAPFSDTSLKEKSLKEALNSDYLRIIRENHGLLNDGQSGCVLWEKREVVKQLLKETADTNPD